jgi:hypothetical protein
MKPPKEILFRRHENIGPKLDAIRASVVRERQTERVEVSPVRDATRWTSVVMKLWQELVWPCRRIWAGMAAVWVAVLIFCLGAQESQTELANNAPQSAPAVMTAWREQRQMMAQLLDPASAEAITRSRIPGPRSEERQTIISV